MFCYLDKKLSILGYEILVILDSPAQIIVN